MYQLTWYLKPSHALSCYHIDFLTVLSLWRCRQMCSVLVFFLKNNSPVNPVRPFYEQLLWQSCVLPGLDWPWGWEELPTFSSPGLSDCLPSSCSSFHLGHSCTSLLLKGLGLEDSKLSGEAVELPWGSLRMARRTFWQDLHGYGCFSLRAGGWKALKGFESQSLSSFLWFCDYQRLSQ